MNDVEKAREQARKAALQNKPPQIKPTDSDVVKKATQAAWDKADKDRKK